MAFFKLTQPKGFNHKPIYYDEDKEIHEKLVEKAKKELGIQDENAEYKPDIKGKFRNSSSGNDHEYTFNFRRTAEKKSNRHVIVLVMLLIAVLYFCYKL